MCQMSWVSEITSTIGTITPEKYLQIMQTFCSHVNERVSGLNFGIYLPQISLYVVYRYLILISVP